jgi:hypothetical protein
VNASNGFLHIMSILSFTATEIKVVIRDKNGVWDV